MLKIVLPEEKMPCCPTCGSGPPENEIIRPMLTRFNGEAYLALGDSKGVPVSGSFLLKLVVKDNRLEIQKVRDVTDSRVVRGHRDQVLIFTDPN